MVGPMGFVENLDLFKWRVKYIKLVCFIKAQIDRFNRPDGINVRG